LQPKQSIQVQQVNIRVGCLLYNPTLLAKNNQLGKRNVFDSCMKSWEYAQDAKYIVEIYVSLAFQRFTQVRRRCLGLRVFTSYTHKKPSCC